MAKTEVARVVEEKRERGMKGWPTSGKTHSSFVVATYSVVLLRVVVKAFTD
jgi:hypothetical protein